MGEKIPFRPRVNGKSLWSDDDYDDDDYDEYDDFNDTSKIINLNVNVDIKSESDIELLKKVYAVFRDMVDEDDEDE